VDCAIAALRVVAQSSEGEMVPCVLPEISRGCPGGDRFCCFRNILGRAEEEQRQARHGIANSISPTVR
jgi:hypothetical protein